MKSHYLERQKQIRNEEKKREYSVRVTIVQYPQKTSNNEIPNMKMSTNVYGMPE